MHVNEQWLECWETETENGIEGYTVYCMTGIASACEYELIKQQYGNKVDATINHGKNPITGEWDSDFSTYNIIWKTPNTDEFIRLGGSLPVAKAHGYDVHPNMRKGHGSPVC